MTDEDYAEPEATAPADFPIVGVGASAGGLEAFGEFLDHLAPDLGMAYVLVQHLAPKHRSVLADLLAARSKMPVTEVTDGLPVEPDHLYVIPPNANLEIEHGVLRLKPPPETRVPPVTIDHFLRSLAQECGSRAIGVILSGTASDGVTGMKAIKAEGGITFAQDEQTARFDSMPRAAIASGCVDYVMAPAAIASELAQLRKRLAAIHAVQTDEGGTEAQQFDAILLLLARRTGVNFVHYKHNTIFRRIRRRMVVHRLDRLSDYAALLRARPVELDMLYNEILINVTAFFRDPAAFDALSREVFPKIVAGAGGSGALRIWVPGCSTGEEPYSIAIALLEYMEEAGVSLPIQIFATDIDAHALDQARAGHFPDSIAADISPARLARHFTRTDHGFRIAKSIREMCLFARQNLVKDPPFSRVDLLSCRNLLIYFGPVLQKKALALFHYALKPTGFMMLGVAETIGKYADMFRTIDAKNKIYMKKAILSSVHFDFSAPPAAAEYAAGPSDSSRPALSLTGRELSMVVDRVIMKKYCPASVVINEQMDIVQFRGQTGEFLEPAAGEASLNLLRMAREGLAMDLRELVTQAIRTRVVTRKEEIPLHRGDETLVVDIEVAPLDFTAAGFFLVVFRASRATPRLPQGDGGDGARHEARLLMLEQELTATREYLQSVIEQDETINEELRSANEEILSSNEELQSTNEELETAKEELQSVNEELSTVNEELETRNRELNQLNNDLSNLLSSVSIPIMILDADLRIRRFTPVAQKHLKLTKSDVGRSINDIRLSVRIPDLRQLLDDAVENASVHEVEGQAHDGRWYAIRVQPYRTVDDKVDGALVAFVDIDESKRGLKLAREARDYAKGIVDAIRQPILVLDQNLKVLSANPAFLETFRVRAEETVGNLLYHLGNGQWGIPRLRAALERVCLHGEGFDDYAVEHEFEEIGCRRFTVCGRAIGAAPGAEPPFLALMQIEIGDGDEKGGSADRE